MTFSVLERNVTGASSCQRLNTAVEDAREESQSYGVLRTAEMILNDVDYRPATVHTPLPPTAYTTFEVSMHTDIGTRAMQEDRLVFCPQLVRDRLDTAFFGVFDGTVGDFASDNVQHLVVPHLIGSPPCIGSLCKRQRSKNCNENNGSEVCQLRSKEPNAQVSSVEAAEVKLPVANDIESLNALNCQLLEADDKASTYFPSLASFSFCNASTALQKDTETMSSENELPLLIRNSVQWMYSNADSELLQRCEAAQRHYASSTAVTMLLLGSYCCVAHLGDSRIALGYEHKGALYGDFLTVDHKPNMRMERDRILRHGGSVEYLHNHNSKPFIRGGDFAVRKARGEQPMQLQYSRAFGGKDLKKFGLSNEPDIRIFKLNPCHQVLVLASDGVWDVQTAAKAVELALLARRTGENAAQFLIRATLGQQEAHCQNVDNLTVIVVFLNNQ